MSRVSNSKRIIASSPQMFPPVAGGPLLCSREAAQSFLYWNKMGRSLLYFMQKRFLTTPSAVLSSASPLVADVSSSKSSFTVDYLVNSCGLSAKSALSVSKKLKLDESDLEKLQSVLQLFKALNFSDVHIAKLIQKMPRVLHCSVENTLRPKLNFLIEIGFGDQRLPELIVLDPYILLRSLDPHLKASFRILRPFFDSNEKFGMSVLRCSWLLSGGFKENLQANLDFLTGEGVSAKSIGKLLLSHPRSISQKHERIFQAVNAVKDLGFAPQAPMFAHAFGVMARMNDCTWNKKIELLKSLGWSEEETLTAFKRYPFFMECSEEKVRSAIDLYTNTIKLSRQDIVSNPVLLMFSMDNRVRRRWNILQALKSNNVKEDINTKRALLIPEKKFLQKYVTNYAENVPELLDSYGGTTKQ